MSNEQELKYKVFAIKKSGGRSASPITLAKVLLEAAFLNQHFCPKFLTIFHNSTYTVFNQVEARTRSSLLNDKLKLSIFDQELGAKIAKSFDTKIKRMLKDEKNKTNFLEIWKMCVSFIKYLMIAQNESKSYRIILAPNPDLKEVQSIIQQDLNNFSVHSSAFGFAKNRSALDCANYHLLRHSNKIELLINLDVKNFFGSVTEKDIIASFSAHGITNERSDYILDNSTITLNLKNAIELMLQGCLSMTNQTMLKDFFDERLRLPVNTIVRGTISESFFPAFIKNYLKSLINISLKNKWITKDQVIEVSKNILNLGPKISLGSKFLPQGSPTSPTISNMAAKRMDYRLSGFAEKHGAIYSRYADDLSFTWEERHGQKFINIFVDSVQSIIKQHGLELNKSKTRVIGTGGRMDIVGYVINSGKPTICVKYIEAVRKEILDLKNCEDHLKYKNLLSYERHMESINGKINFIATASPDKAQKLKNLVTKITHPHAVVKRRIEVVLDHE